MPPLFQKADDLSRQVIGAAIESIYERCLLRELDLRVIRGQPIAWLPRFHIPSWA
jgi:hypothetical protein